jgi:methylmalonyl-CoA/ethylmalonyl-CoA epimerase
VNVRGLAHVGILVPDLEPARALFLRLGCPVTGPELDEELGLRLLWVEVGQATLELVAPARDDSRAAAAIARGEVGVHHVALRVDDVRGAIAELVAAGIPVRDVVPRRGAHGSRVGFLDPSAAGGALIELVEP